jgi:hypothetical protein
MKRYTLWRRDFEAGSYDYVAEADDDQTAIRIAQRTGYKGQEYQIVDEEHHVFASCINKFSIC